MTSKLSTKKRVRIVDCLVLCTAAIDKVTSGLNSDVKAAAYFSINQ